jgi:cell division transport system permease protein
MMGDYANGDSLCMVKTELQKRWHQVTDVAYQEDQIEDVNRNLHRINLILLVLAVLLIFVCYSLVSNSVRLSVYSRRFTIHTMKLVGAPWSFIRRPFLQSAMTVALLASLLACVVLGGVAYALYRYQPGVEDIIAWPELAVTAAAVFVFGFVIMLLCTMLSVNKFLRMRAGELYEI